MAVPSQQRPRNQKRDEMARRDRQDSIVKRHDRPEVILVLEKLARQARIGERLGPIAIHRHQEEREQAHVGQRHEQELIEKVLAHFASPVGRAAEFGSGRCSGCFVLHLAAAPARRCRRPARGSGYDRSGSAMPGGRGPFCPGKASALRSSRSSLSSPRLAGAVVVLEHQDEAPNQMSIG